MLLLPRAPRLIDPVPPPMDGEETGACPISPGDVIVGKGPPNMRDGGGGKMDEATAELIPGLSTLPNIEEEEEECGDRTEEEAVEEEEAV